MKYIISIFIILSFTVSFLVAQEIAMKHFTVNDGLPSNTVYRILEDEMGYIWMATENGVVKYNGKEFKIYNRQNQKYKKIGL